VTDAAVLQQMIDDCARMQIALVVLAAALVVLVLLDVLDAGEETKP